MKTLYTKPRKKQKNPHVGPVRPAITRLRRQIIDILAEGIRDENGVLVRWCNQYELGEKLGGNRCRITMLQLLRPMIAKGLICRMPRMLFDTLDGQRWRTLYAPSDWVLDNLDKIKHCKEKVYVPIIQELPEDESGIIVMEGFDDLELPELPE